MRSSAHSLNEYISSLRYSDRTTIGVPEHYGDLPDSLKSQLNCRSTLYRCSIGLRTPLIEHPA